MYVYIYIYIYIYIPRTQSKGGGGVALFSEGIAGPEMGNLELGNRFQHPTFWTRNVAKINCADVYIQIQHITTTSPQIM